MVSVKAFVDIFAKLRYVMNSQQKRESILVLILLILGSFLDLLGVSIILPFVYALLDIEKLKSQKYIKPILDFWNIDSDNTIIFISIGTVIIIYIVKNVASMVIKYRQEKFSCGYKKEISIRMLEAFLNQPYEFFLDANLAEILRGVFSDVEGSYNMLSAILRIFSGFFGIFVIGVYLFYTDFFISIGLFGIGIICVLFLFAVVKNRTKEIGYKQRELSAAAYKSVCQSINGIKDILVMRRQKEFLKDYENAYEEKRKIDILYNCLLGMPNKVIETFFISGLVIVVGIRAIMIGNADNTAFLAKIAVFAFGAIKLLPYISAISSDLTQLVYMRMNIISVYNNFKSTEGYNKRTEFKQDKENLTFNQTLSVNNISWRYKGVKRDVFKQLSLNILKGEAIGIVGESGAGKSTLVDIVLGLFRPYEGDVLVDNRSIFSNLEEWAHTIGYVPQSIYLLDDTIRNNVLFGAEYEGNDDKIWSVIEEAQLMEFVKSLPDGLDTVVGERGVKMSGGQRQRVAIARTLYYNPDILILDEATSALDNETEDALMKSIDALQGTKTLIIVAHRLTTIANCDRVYEVGNGVIREREKESLFR